MPIGAEVLASGQVSFRVWAPKRKSVAVALVGQTVPLAREPDGYWSGAVKGVRAGDTYRFQLDGSDSFPDPASRYQPEGPHGPSAVVDPAAFSWTDASWKGLALEGQVIYELHIGTFTQAGTWQSAMDDLPELARLGVTVIEMMPVADFPGSFGWGYDGVNLFAPTRIYGSPDDLRSFVDRAHSLEMAVILDVVYNHFGPDGNYLSQFSKDYFTSKYTTDWGEAINYDGIDNGPVRELVCTNAGYWIEEFHIDGLRLDATQNVYDESAKHILSEVTAAVRKAAPERLTIVIAENEPQHVRLIRPVEQGGYGMDGLWNDDYHHAAMVALTGHKEAYYTDYGGTPQEFISAFKYGYLYQGQHYRWQKSRRGKPAFGVAPSTFVTFLQNHDQVANSGRGLRAHELSSPGLYKAMTAMTLLGPGTPMLFQGQEYAASQPFYFFADHQPELAALIAKGRREFLYQWRSLKTGQFDKYLTDPGARETFEACKLDPSERARHASAYALTKDLLRLRREDATIAHPVHFDGAVLSTNAFVLRTFGEHNIDRLLIVNLGVDLHLSPAPEPLLAPPEDKVWKLVFSTEDPAYGGCGTDALESDDGWHIPGQSALLLVPE